MSSPWSNPPPAPERAPAAPKPPGMFMSMGDVMTLASEVLNARDPEVTVDFRNALSTAANSLCVHNPCTWIVGLAEFMGLSAGVIAKTEGLQIRGPDGAPRTLPARDPGGYRFPGRSGRASAVMSLAFAPPAGWQHPLPWVADAYHLEGRRLALFEAVCLRLRVNPDTGCWEWTGPTSGSTGRGKDYPRMSYMGQTIAVHRGMWTVFHGYLPGKKHLDHVCRNRICINPFPEHTEPVTHLLNCRRRDAALKGNHHGEPSSN
jgi:hypothetical protein